MTGKLNTLLTIFNLGLITAGLTVAHTKTNMIAYMFLCITGGLITAIVVGSYGELNKPKGRKSS